MRHLDAANSLGVATGTALWSREAFVASKSSLRCGSRRGRGLHLAGHYRTLLDASPSQASRRRVALAAPAGSVRTAPDPLIRRCDNPRMPTPHTRPTVLAVWLMIAGAIGWWAAFSLTMERFAQLADPDAGAGCDFSVLVQCSANLASEQGSAFGFPNPILGLTGWVAPIVVGAAILAGARFDRWFWILFTAGMTFAFGFVVWLIGQSIFVLGTLCPWCMVTWVVTIPSFYAVILHAMRIGAIPVPRAAQRAADRAMSWLPLLAVASYAIIAVIAQLRLDVLATFI